MHFTVNYSGCVTEKCEECDPASGNCGDDTEGKVKIITNYYY